MEVFGVWDRMVAYRSVNRSKSVQLSRALHGYRDRSNNGRYRYWRQGLLEKIPNLQFLDGVVLVREEDVHQLVELLEKYGAEYFVSTLQQTPKQPAR